MRTSPMRVLAIVVGSLVATLLAACGGGGGGSTKVGDIPTPVSGQKKGGTLRVLSNEGFEHLDPGASYFQVDYEAVYAVHRPLYSYKPDDFQRPASDLAAGPPKISKDDKTVTIKIRPGIRYSPGTVNRTVTSADVKYALERVFNPSVAGGAGAYLQSIVGADKAKGGPLSGVQTPDKTTLVIKLTKPFGATLAQALTLPISAPVPKEYAAKFDKSSPSKYDVDPTIQAFTGPYVIKSYKAGKSLTLTRNSNWNGKATGDYRPAYLDRINWTVGVDANVAGRQILTGSHVVNGDTPTAPIIKLGVQRHKDQINFTPSGNRYIAMNTQLKPFDDVNVRRAVVAATDRTALQLTRGGKVAGIIATHFLGPTVPGFKEAGGEKGFGFDFLANPNGDMKVAAKYLKKAGFKSGRYSGPPILMVGNNEDPAAKSAAVALQAFKKLGFKVDFRGLKQETMYSKFCNVPKAKVHVCPNVGWIPDFPDGYSWTFVPFDSSTIVPENNSNWPQLKDPKVDAAIAKAQAEVDPGARAKAFAEVDRLVTSTAAAVPWFWDTQPNIEAKDVQGVIAQWNASWDPNFTSLK
jgi:peptide/nickel transport system substrate-binding protein